MAYSLIFHQPRVQQVVKILPRWGQEPVCPLLIIRYLRTTRQWQEQGLFWNIPALEPWGSRADSRLSPSQWETSLQSNAVSRWLAAKLESSPGFTLLLKDVSTILYPLRMWNKTRWWSLWMDEWFHPTLYNGWNYLPMLGLKCINSMKGAPEAYP